MSNTPLLSLQGIDKAFPGVLANQQVDVEVAPGSIHALLGENGAGKSTLVKIIYGVLHPDAGAIHWQGERVDVPSPHAARRLGIGMVFQHFSLFDALSVTENIALGLDDAPDMAALRERIVTVSADYGLPLDPDRHVYTLSVGERQRIEIVRCLLQEPKLLIMDEPTSVLTPQETEKLFATLRRLAAEGCAVLYISHKLYEIQALCDTATIMRGGRVVASCDPRQETAHSLAEMMIGEELQPAVRGAAAVPGEVRLEVHTLDLPADDQFGTDLYNISLAVHGGEILGIAGVAGNGQAELLAALSGETPLADNDQITICGTPCGQLDAGARRALGLAFVPEERLGHGAVPEMSLVDNTLLSGYRRHGLIRLGVIDYAGAEREAAGVVEQFDVRTPGVGHVAGSLSGGNLQKFIVGREVRQAPRLLIVAQPTWGVDAGAAAAIHQALLDLTETGTGILLISQDLDEVLAVSDRVAVISGGRLSAAQPRAAVDAGHLGMLMAGLHDIDDPGGQAHAAEA